MRTLSARSAQCPFHPTPAPEGSTAATDRGLCLPPSLPGGWPLLGHAPAFARDPIGLLQHGYARFGEVFRFRLATRDVHALIGPAGNAAFFRAPEEQLSAREAYRFTVPIFGRGIAYGVEPEIMSEQVGFIMPALRESRLRTYTGAIVREVEDYLSTRWRSEGETDLLRAMNELTIFIASRCLIGQEFRSRLTDEFAQLYRALEGGINLVAFLWPYFPRPAHRRRDHARARMVELISAIIEERRASGARGEDFLQTLMEARYKNGRPLSHHEIAGLLLTLIFAGQHTSAILAAWTLILLAQAPDDLLRVRSETDEWYANGARTFDALRELTWLERAIKEAERMYPPLVMLMRTIRRDFEHGGYRMPAGGMALISPAVSHRLPQVFANPDQYDLERFGPERAEDKRTPHALIAFGGGRHRCAGAAFAYLQVKIIVSVLLRCYELQFARSDYAPDYHTWVVGPETPCLVRYRARLSS